MKKNGFTLIELFAVIIVIAVIALITTPVVISVIKSSKDEIYKNNESIISKAANRYLSSNISLVPKDKSYANIISLSTLVSKGYVKAVSDPSGGTCDGYVTITKKDSGYDQTTFLKCGTNYETTGYLSTMQTASKGLILEVLVVAGGGSGGGQGLNDGSGGGGAGGLIFNSYYLAAPTTSISITVGAGGAAVPMQTTGKKGDNSVFGTLTAIGGGFGGAEGGTRNGGPGGSGGGAGGYSMSWVGGVATTGQGNNGGANLVTAYPNYGGGGGGGAGAVGISGTSQVDSISGHASGGAGLYFGDKFGNYYGHNGWFAGGGGNGGGYGTGIYGYGGLGGIGGGGSGGHSVANSSTGTSGMPNTGGGGGGAGGRTVGGIGNSGAGGSGIVLIRYLGTPKATGGTIRSFNGYTIHSFTTTGASTFQLSAF